MQKGLTDITIVLDRSGSMQERRDDTIGGFKLWLEEQRKADGHAVVSLLQFNETLEWSFTAKPLSAMQPLSATDYLPNGATALLDAMGTAINLTGDRLHRTAESLRPEKVIVLTISDGMENSSHLFTKPQVAGLITQQSDVYKWLFMFTGTNFDAIGEGASLNVNTANAMNFTSGAGGMVKAFYYAAQSVSRARAASVNVDEMPVAAAYTIQERTDALTSDDE